MVQTDEERKARAKKRESTPAYKKTDKAYNSRPEIKEKKKIQKKEYDSRLENKEKKKKRESTPAYKAKEKTRQSTPAYKANQRITHSTPEYLANRKVREQSQEYKETHRTYGKKPETIARSKIQRDEKRFKILQYYSKLLSKSNIPCCNCCGIKSHIDFLEFDHIAGKKQMDSEPRLVKLGYSSKFRQARLLTWIRDNNFPKGFQILCKNCNGAKGMKKNNNKCPMENKPH